jgi:large subunit ribosomal protein L25
MVPGVIYGGSQEINFYAPTAAFKNFVYTPSFQIAEVVLEGKTYRTILKDLQFDKVDDKLIHIDLLELVEDKKVIADIPVKFVGTSKGVKDGGKLVTKMKSLKIKTYPKFLKEQIEVPIDTLELNGNIRVEDVKEPNYEILNSPRIPVASVVMTRQLKQEELLPLLQVLPSPLLLPLPRSLLPKNKVLHELYKPVSTDAGFLLAITDI